MKKILFVITIIMLSNICVMDANAMMGGQTQDSRNGKAFTPRGDLRVLLVCVGYGDNDALLDTGAIQAAWPLGQEFPNVIIK